MLQDTSQCSAAGQQPAVSQDKNKSRHRQHGCHCYPRQQSHFLGERDGQMGKLSHEDGLFENANPDLASSKAEKNQPPIPVILVSEPEQCQQLRTCL
jgi:hypothetical protein